MRGVYDHKLVCKLFEFTKSTFYNWKKEERPIIALLEKYFSGEDLQEFLETGNINRLDKFIEFDNLKETDKDFLLFKEFVEFQKFKNSRSESTQPAPDKE